MSREPDKSKDDILKRFKRIEGQIKGIQRMIEGDKDCMEILTQVAAVRAAINNAGSLILENYSMKCIENAVSSENNDQAIEDLVRAMKSFIKFTERG